jgi:hypothetical protein
MPTGIFTDGDFTVASAVGPVLTHAPIPIQPATLVYTQTFWQLAANFSPLALSLSPAASGMTPPAGGGSIYLVEETKRINIDGGVVAWDRVWAKLPSTYSEPLGYWYAVQIPEVFVKPWFGVYDASVPPKFFGTYKTFQHVSEWSEPLKANITYDFYLTKAAAEAAFIIPRRTIKKTILDPNWPGNNIEYQIDLGTVGYAEPSEITRWMGDIWRVKNLHATSGIP